MKQIINARCNNGRVSLYTFNKELKSIIKPLQFLLDNKLFDENINLHAEVNKKNDMFIVVFNFNNEFTFNECVINRYNEYIQIQNEYKYFLKKSIIDRNAVKAKLSAELSSLSIKLYEELSETHEEDILPILEKRFNEERKVIDIKYKEESDRAERNYEYIVDFYSYSV